MILTVIIAILAGCGICLVLYLLAEALSMPIAANDAYYVVRLNENASKTAQTVRSCLRRADRCRMLIFVDDGLDAEGQMAVELLLRHRTDAILCAPSQVCEMIRWGSEDVGAGAD